MKGGFPTWVPPFLIKIHADMARRNAEYINRDHPVFRQGRERQALLERLLQPRMERAWAEILKRIDSLGDSSGLIFFQVSHALDEAARPQEGRAEKAARHQAIAKSAREFARAVHWSELDTTPYRWFPDEVISAFLGMMRPELAEGSWCPLEPPPIVPKGRVFSGSVVKRIDGQGVYWPFGLYDGLGGFFESLVKPQYPTMAQIALAVAEDATRIAKEALSEPRILPRPGIENARRIVFIRHLGSFFKNECGGYLKRTLAAFATAALQEDVTPDHVSDALRGFKPFPYQGSLYSADRPRAGYIRPDDPRLK